MGHNDLRIEKCYSFCKLYVVRCKSCHLCRTSACIFWCGKKSSAYLVYRGHLGGAMPFVYGGLDTYGIMEMTRKTDTR